MSDRESVEVHRAVTWDCPRCGTENFERFLRVEAGTPHPKRAEHNIALGDAFWMSPGVVECRICLAEFDSDESQL